MWTNFELLGVINVGKYQSRYISPGGYFHHRINLFGHLRTNTLCLPTRESDKFFIILSLAIDTRNLGRDNLITRVIVIA